MSLISYNLQSLGARRGTALATIAGVALVTLVLSASSMLAAGVERTLAGGARSDVAVVLRRGADAELPSSVDEEAVRIVSSAPGVSLASPELVVVAALPKIGSVGFANLSIRGVDPEAYRLRERLKIVEGRMPTPGTDEAIVGQRIRGRLEGLELGARFELKRNRPLQIVGVFADDGSANESEVWADRRTIASSFGRSATVSSVRLVTESIAPLVESLEHDPRISVSVADEPAFEAAQSRGLGLFIRSMGIMVALLFSVGAVIGAAITMHGAVAQRRREIGTLRALGFSGRSILVGFLFETLTLTSLGGLIGACASFCLGAVEISMVNQSSWSELVFGFLPTPSIVVGSLVMSTAIGLVAGFVPALRASRISALVALAGR